MATAMPQKSLSVSTLAGSDGLFDFPCQPCSTHNLHVDAVDAVGFCHTCDEYLCDNCCKLSATKQNTMSDKSVKTKSKLRPKTKDVLKKKCPKHEGKILEYVCNGHNQLCCSVCTIMQHKTCKFSYIPEVSNGIANNDEYKKLMTDLDRLLSSATKQQRNNNRKNEDNKNYHSKALTNIKRFRQQINHLLDKLENETTMKISELNLENLEKIKIESDTCKSIITDVKYRRSRLEKSATSGKENQLFVKMMETKAHLLEIEKGHEGVDAKIKQYSFHQDEAIQKMMTSLSAIWSLSLRKDNMTSTVVRCVQRVNIKFEGDTQDCTTNGVAVLTGERMVVTDYESCKVKLIDMEKNILTSCLSLSSRPSDVIETKLNQIAVALPDAKKLEILTVSDVLIRSHTIDTHGVDIVGICYDGSHFITTCQKPPSVKIIDMDGRTLNTFTTDNGGNDLFTMPRFIAISRNKDIIYVTDKNSNTMTSMNTGGHVIFVYRHDKLKEPCGVAVDRYGIVYVCSRKTHTVHQLSPTGDLKLILLTQDQGLVPFPTAIDHSDKEDILYISSSSTVPENRNYINQFQLEQRF